MAKLKTAFIFILLLFTFKARAENPTPFPFESFYTPIGRYYQTGSSGRTAGQAMVYRTSSLLQHLGEGDLTFDAIRQIIQKNGIQSLDGFLKFASTSPQLKPFYENFVLMHNSQSSQRDSVSFSRPRVILHSPENRMVLAFTTDPTRPDAYNQLEIIELPKGASEFQFNRIQFRNGGAPQFQKNEESCRDCHGSNPRPIWGTYHLWPGAYAGLDDNQLGNEEENRSLSQFRENQELRKFWQPNGRPGRLGLLPFPKEFSLEYPFGRRNNLMLQGYLNALNTYRLGNAIGDSPAWRAYRHVIAGVIKNCKPIIDFFPESLRRKHEKVLEKRWEQLTEDTGANRRREAERRIRLFDRYNQLRGTFRDPFMLQDSGITELSAMRFILDGQELDPKFKLTSWGLSFPPGGSQSHYSVQTTSSDGWEAILHTVIKPQLARDGIDLNSTCDALKLKSLESLRNIPMEEKKPHQKSGTH